MLGILYALAAAATGVHAKSVELSLEAPWHDPSEATLALETLAKYNSSAYFPLLTAVLTERENGKKVSTSNEVVELAVRSSLLDEALVGLAKQEIALGSAIPTLEAQFEDFEAIESSSVDVTKCPVVLWTEGTYSCDITDLYALQAPEKPLTPRLFPTDHVIGSGPQWIVIYADLDADELAGWHAVLLEMALSNKITYVLRQRPSLTTNSRGNSVKLAGYAAGMHIKNTNYLVVDDRNLEGELDINRDAHNAVPKSKLPTLGFIAAHNVRNHGSNDIENFEYLKDIAYNFPQHAVALSQQDFTEDEIESIRTENKLGGHGLNGVFINGDVLNTRDIYEFYENVHEQLRLIQTLQSHLPNNTDVAELLTSGVAMDDYDDASGESTRPKQRYDLRASASAIGWVNDVEKDMVFQVLGDDLEVIKKTMGPFVPIRKNMHSVVVAGNIRDSRLLSILKMLLQQSGQTLPLQIGIVSDDETWLRVAKLGMEARQAYLIQILLGSSQEEAEKHSREAYEESGNPVQEELGDPHEWMNRFGVEDTHQPVLFVNGVPLTLDTWGELAMHIFQKDFKFLQDSVDSIDPEDSLRDLLFATGMEKRNKLLDPVGGAVFSPWPLTSPIQPFKNPEMAKVEAGKQHAVLLSSSFKTPAAFRIAEAIIERSTKNKDVELFVRPLAGIDEKFYNAMFDPLYNTFRFSSNLFSSVRSHFFDRKTAPKVLNAAKPAEPSVLLLPTDTDSLLIDGRYVEITGSEDDITTDLLDQLIDRESPRLQRLASKVPDITALGVAALTAAGQGRTMISDAEAPDIVVQRGDGTPPLKLTAVVDPASEEAQSIIALTDLAIGAGLSVSLYLSPSEIVDMPKRFYQPLFDRKQSISFTNLQEDVLYSTEFIDPTAWMTSAEKSEYDLDNVLLNTVKGDKLEAVFALRSVLVQGFARGPTAPGTRLYLKSAIDGEKVAETSVMANLGYFQLSAPSPGLYEVCMSDPETSIRLTTGTVDCVKVPVVQSTGVSNLQINIVPEAPETVVGVKPQESNSIWGKLKGAVKRSDAPQADVNIFTVASGHLYERFASIMMLSVMQHSKHSVKFWLLENFISPKFRETLPALAKEYNFDYEFVSYKWPTWLRGQSEKQRQIWGYKILFLDVLFPPTLSDIIFVDSDQIARTDFKELLDIDLEGAPYAFTPMGDDRPEMEPYRFWKQGFWKQALIDEGYKYHISALFRVDLNRFRKSKTGDILRHQYQRLSANPENLANLDQDLPNSLQNVVPIYSLPQEWLWCETWCHDNGLDWAKTIDLCNNPLTTESKLDRARRLIPEWTEYDEKVAAVEKSVAEAKLRNAQAVEQVAEQVAEQAESTEHDEVEHDEL